MRRLKRLRVEVPLPPPPKPLPLEIEPGGTFEVHVAGIGLVGRWKNIGEHTAVLRHEEDHEPTD